MDAIEILLLAHGLVILGVILWAVYLIRGKLQAVGSTVQDVGQCLHHQTDSLQEELSVLLTDTEKQISQRFSRVRGELEEFFQYQRMSHVSPICHYDFLVPTELLKMMVDRNRYSVIAQEREYLRELQLDIRNNGLREPLIVAYDDRGQMMLHEGHHRLRVLDGYQFLPVRLKKIPKSAGTFNPVNVERLFAAFAKEHYAPPY